MMSINLHAQRNCIGATIGPVSSSPDVARRMLLAGMNAARLNFSPP